MRRTTSFLILIVSVSLCVIALRCKKDKDETPILNTENFSRLLGENTYVFANFYAPWCDYCKQLAPAYDQLHEELKDQANLAIVKVDATVERTLSARCNVSGYPTMILFKNGEVYLTYQNEHTAEGMKKWLEAIISKDVTPVRNKAELENFINTKNLMRFVFVGKEGECLDMFKKHCLSSEMAESSCTYTNVTGITDQLDSDDTTYLFDGYDIYRYAHGRDCNAEDYRAWLNDNSEPSLQPFSLEQTFIYSIVAKNKPIVVYFYENPEHLATIVNLSQTFKGSVIFTEANSNSMSLDFLKTWGASGEKFPVLILVLSEGSKFFNWDESVELTEKNAEKWIKACVVDDNCVPWKKSAPIPTDNDKPIKVLVHDSFKKMVEENPKSVLVKYYTPWCEHCRHIKPIFEELAERCSNMSDMLMLADYDCSENYVDPMVVNMYPLLMLYKHDDKSNPIVYDGERTVEDMFKWISNNMQVHQDQGRDEL